MGLNKVIHVCVFLRGVPQREIRVLMSFTSVIDLVFLRALHIELTPIEIRTSKKCRRH